MYSKKSKIPKIKFLLSERFEEISQKILQGKYDLNFGGNGLFGTCWMIQHLRNIHLLDIEANQLLFSADELARQAIYEHINLNNHDFFNGSSGIFLYLIERKNEAQPEILVESVKHLTDRFNGSFLEYKNIQSKVNLSLSHGLSGKIWLYSKLLKIYPENKTLKNQLCTCVDFLLSNFVENPLMNFSKLGGLYSKSYFPNFSESTTHDYNSRLAWCYGDLGAAMALYAAGSILHKKELIRISDLVFTNSISRQTFEQTQIRDAGICHGYAGIALMYNRMYLNTKKIIFKENANLFCGKAIDFYANHNDNLNNLATFGSLLESRPDNGLLTGTAGIVLTSFAVFSKDNYSWDTCLMLS